MARLLNQVFGHEKNIERLLTAISKNRMPNSQLFIGPSGIGKRRVAQGLAQALVCEKGSLGCGECPACKRVESEQSESYLRISPQSTQIKIEQSRMIQDFLSLRRLGKARIIIIDDAHQLNTQAANALLKILEEPPAETYFFLISPSASNLLPTIRSRCQKVFFAPLKTDIVKKISDAQDWMIQSSQGRMDLIEYLKDPELKKTRLISFEILRSVFENSKNDIFKEISNLVKDKETSLFVSQCWQQILRDITIKKLEQTHFIHQDQVEIIALFARLSEDQIDSVAQRVFSLEKDILQNVDRTLLFENFWIQTHNLVSGV